MAHKKYGSFYERTNSINNGYDSDLDTYDFIEIIDEAKAEFPEDLLDSDAWADYALKVETWRNKWFGE